MLRSSWKLGVRVVRGFVENHELVGREWQQGICPAVSIRKLNLQRAVLESAEIKAAGAAMEAKYKPRVAEIEQLNKEIAAINQNLQSNAGKLTPQAEGDLSAQAQRKQRDIQRKQDDLQADVDRERNDILQRAGTRMTEVVKKLSEEKGYDFVADRANLVYFKPAIDITNDAIAAYDKTHPAK